MSTFVAGLLMTGELGTIKIKIYRHLPSVSYLHQFVRWQQFYCNLPKIGPPLKTCPSPFMNKLVTKRTFLSKVHPPIYETGHAVMLSKKH